jgi:hypothetical protein
VLLRAWRRFATGTHYGAFQLPPQLKRETQGETGEETESWLWVRVFDLGQARSVRVDVAFGTAQEVCAAPAFAIPLSPPVADDPPLDSSDDESDPFAGCSQAELRQSVAEDPEERSLMDEVIAKRDYVASDDGPMNVDLPSDNLPCLLAEYDAASYPSDGNIEGQTAFSSRQQPPPPRRARFRSVTLPVDSSVTFCSFQVSVIAEESSEEAGEDRSEIRAEPVAVLVRSAGVTKSAAKRS